MILNYNSAVGFIKESFAKEARILRASNIEEGENVIHKVRSFFTAQGHEGRFYKRTGEKWYQDAKRNGYTRSKDEFFSENAAELDDFIKKNNQYQLDKAKDAMGAATPSKTKDFIKAVTPIAAVGGAGALAYGGYKMHQESEARKQPKFFVVNQGPVDLSAQS